MSGRKTGRETEEKEKKLGHEEQGVVEQTRFMFCSCLHETQSHLSQAGLELVM